MVFEYVGLIYDVLQLIEELFKKAHVITCQLIAVEKHLIESFYGFINDFKYILVA